jgi:hypothetical protein
MWFLLHREGLSLMDGDFEKEFFERGTLKVAGMAEDAGTLVVDARKGRPAKKPTPTPSKEEHPRGVWLWELSKLPRDYLDRLVKCGVQRVYLKVFDDASKGDGFWSWQCTPAIIKAFNDKGIEVWGWGYHFDRRTKIDAPSQATAVKRAMDCGLGGYVVDVEVEVKDPATHKQLENLLRGLKSLVGPLGYTSMGAPQYHPEIPWKLLDEHCDLAFPQMYFEKWAYGKTDDAEVAAAFAAHKKLGLKKPILPIWGSESDTKAPASAKVLQEFLNLFPGSSLWRAPNAGERGEAFNLDYRGALQDPDVGDGGTDKSESLPRPNPGTIVAKLTRAANGAINAEYTGAWSGIKRLELSIGDELFSVASGARGAQTFRRPTDPRSVPGNLEPIPQGSYSIADISWAGGKDNYEVSHGAGLGPVWVGLDAEFSDDRGSFGFHLDANRGSSPGSAGCVVFRSVDDLKRFVAALRKHDPKTLNVDWGLDQA